MTIFALSTAPGRAGIAVFRLSGPGTRSAIERLSGASVPAPRRASLRTFKEAAGGPIDQGLLLWLPGPGSFTGEDMAELHVHGGPAVIAAMAEALAAIDGLRPAEPGEFSRRAFDNGRLDLTEIEGMADLIAAETEAQRRQAVRQMSGALGTLYEGWRAALIHALAYLEADLDFADEDVPDDLFASVRPQVHTLAHEIKAHLDDARRGERLREGYQVVIVGPPNVGKSSLMNALSQRDVAIVSDIAGTTRDLIEVHLDLAGYPVTLVDTAGLREGGDIIEREGVKRALARAEGADLTIEMFSAQETQPPKVQKGAQNTIFVANKVDLASKSRFSDEVIRLSVRTGEGLSQLLSALEARVVGDMGGGGPPSLTRLRHRTALEFALGHLEAALAASGREGSPELMAEDLRLAARALGRITGRVDVEDLLDVIFADFCIGK